MACHHGIFHRGCRLCLFPAKDGRRDDLVTGIQTCALPISRRPAMGAEAVSTGSGRSGSGRTKKGKPQIGRASCRERVWMSVVGDALNKKKGSGGKMETVKVR